MTDLKVEGGCYVCLLNFFIIERFGLVSWLRATSFQFLATVTIARRARLKSRQVLRVTEYGVLFVLYIKDLHKIMKVYLPHTKARLQAVSLFLQI